jgi:hypothetical protein
MFYFHLFIFFKKIILNLKDFIRHQKTIVIHYLYIIILHKMHYYINILNYIYYCRFHHFHHFHHYYFYLKFIIFLYFCIFY